MSKHSWAALAGALAFTSLTAWSAPAGAAAGEWTRVPAPSPGATSSLHAVGASSSSVAWAVGETRDALGGLPQPLILRLRDGAWVPARVPENVVGSLLDVAVLGPDDAWAVGVALRVTGSEALVLHWNGVRWSRSSSGSSTRPDVTVTGVAARAPNDVWALGTLRPTRDISQAARAWGIRFDGAVWRSDLPRFRPYNGAGVEDVAAAAGRLVAGGWGLTTGLKGVWGVGDGASWDFSQRVTGPRFPAGTSCAPPDLPRLYRSARRCTGLLGVALRDDGAALGVGETARGGYAGFAPSFGSLPTDALPPDAATQRLLDAAAGPGSGAPFLVAGSVFDPAAGAQRPLLLAFDGLGWSVPAIEPAVLGRAGELAGVAMAPDASGFAVGSLDLGGGVRRTLVLQLAPGY